MVHDVYSAKVDAQYHEEKVKRQVQDGNADIEWIGGLLRNATATIATWFQQNSRGTNVAGKASPIGKMQSNLN